MANNLGTASGSIVVDTSGLKNADLALRSAGGGLLNFGEMLVGAFAKVVGAAAEYQKNMDTIAAISDATGDQIADLSQLGIDMAKNSIFGPNELARAFTELTKAGATVPDLVNGVAAAAVALASATGESIVFAGENLLGIMNTFKLSAADAMAASDILAGAANASAIDLQDLVISMKYAGPVASALGIDLLDTATAITELGKVNIKGSTAGTALRAILLNLTPASTKAEDAMKALGIITEDGSNQFYDAEGHAKDLADIFQILQDKTKGLTDQAKVEALRDIFGVRAVPAALELMKQGAQGFADLQAQVQQTTAQEVATERTDNLSGSVDKLKATIEALMVEAGGPFQTMIQGWVEWLTNLLKAFDDLPDGVKTFIVGMLGGIGILSIFAGAFLITIGNIIRMIRVFGELQNAFSVVGGGIAGAIRAMASFGGAILGALGPIGWIILAIAAIIAIAIILYNKFTWFHDFIDRMWQSIQRIWDGVLNFFRDVWGSMQGIWDDIVGFFNAAKRAWSAFVDLFQTSTITNALRAVADWAQGVADSLVDAWEAVKDWVSDVADTLIGGIEDALDAVVGFFEDLPGNIVEILDGIWEDAKDFGADILDALGNAAKAAVRAFLDFMSQLPYRIGYILGASIALPIRFSIEMFQLFVRLGTQLIQWIIQFGVAFVKEFVTIGIAVIAWVIQFHIDMIKKFIEIGGEILSTFIDIVKALPGLFAEVLLAVLNFAIQFGIDVVQKVWDIASAIVSTMVDILMALPGQIWNIFTTIVTNLAAFALTILAKAIEIGTSLVSGIINIVTNLPGQIWDILTSMVGKLVEIIPSLVSSAISIGGSLFTGIKDGLGDLKSWLWNVVKEAFDALKGIGRTIWNIGKDIATGFLGGIKDFLFGSPHTKVEYWFWDMEDNVTQSMKNVQAQTKKLNALGATGWSTSSNLSAAMSSYAGGPGAAVSGAAPGWTINGPLLHVETLTGTQEEALSISRRLSDLAIQNFAAQGKRATLNGVS